MSKIPTLEEVCKKGGIYISWLYNYRGYAGSAAFWTSSQSYPPYGYWVGLLSDLGTNTNGWTIVTGYSTLWSGQDKARYICPFISVIL